MLRYKQNLSESVALLVALTAAAAWLVYFVFAPTIGFYWFDSWHDEQRVIQVGLLLSSTIAYLLFFKFIRTIPIVTPNTAIWITFACGALSAAKSDLPLPGFIEVALFVQLALLAALSATLIAMAVKEGLSVLLLSAAWLIAAVYVAGVAANYVGVLVEHRQVEVDTFVLGYANPRFASALHALLLPLLASLAFEQSARPSLRYSSFFLAASLWAINLMIGTRAIWVAFFAAAMLFALLGPRARQTVRSVGLTALVGISVYCILWFMAPDALPRIGTLTTHVGDGGSVHTRLDLWIASMQAVLAHPLLGIGPMNFAALRDLDGAHPHNWLLQVASEWGAPALIIFIYAIYSWARQARLAIVNLTTEVSIALCPVVFSVLAALFYGLFDGNWVMPVSQSLAVILAGASIGLIPKYAGPHVHSSSKSMLAVTVTVALFSGLILGTYAFGTVGKQREIEKQYRLDTQNQRLLPRFWEQGLIIKSAPESFDPQLFNAIAERPKGHAQ